MVGFGRESGRSFPLRRSLEVEIEAVAVCCRLRTGGTDFIPAMMEHAELGVTLQGGVALLIELDW